MPALLGVSRGKLILVNDDDLTYCSLRLDPESLQTALDRIADIADPLPRTLAWSAAWEMTRDAELRARDFVSLVSGGVHAETEVGVAQRLLLQAQTALSSYADPDWAASEGWPAFADRLLELARAAEPRLGSSAGLRQRAVHVGAVDRGTSRCWPICSTTIPPSWTWPACRSTPICAGASSRRWPPPARSTPTAPETPFIDAEAQARPDRGGQTARRRRPRPRGRRRRSRRRRGRR